MRRRSTKNFYESELAVMQKNPDEKANKIGGQIPYHLQYAREKKVEEMKIETVLNLVDGYSIAVGARYVLMKECGSHTRVIAYTDTLEDALKKFLSMYQVDLLTDLGGGMFDYIKSIEEGNKRAIQAVKRVLEVHHEKKL